MRRHETDLVSLTFGLAALGVTVVALVGSTDSRRWAFPAVLVGVALLGLLAAGLQALAGRDRS